MLKLGKRMDFMEKGAPGDWGVGREGGGGGARLKQPSSLNRSEASFSVISWLQKQSAFVSEKAVVNVILEHPNWRTRGSFLLSTTCCRLKNLYTKCMH